MKFRDFLLEKVEKHAVMAFGRMNPPTAGHEKLVNKVKEIAKTVGGTAHVVVSHTQDSKKNPLSAEQKVKYVTRAFSGVIITSSDTSAPNFLAQAAKLYKQGVTHFHMVGGSDRIEEFHKLLHKYNGVKGSHGFFDFKHIEVHSAGERDPDAEGVEGMSASKMREHAARGNFKEFRKGVPSKFSDKDAQEMYRDVRRGMNIKEDINLEFDDLLTEGVHDKGIFKAVFLFGGPGSGKDFVLSKTLDGHGLTEINSDKAFEFLMDKNNLDMRMPENEKERRNVVRERAKSMTELRQRLALFGRNGLIINGTGDDVEKTAKIKERLENLGYETSGIMVNTADEVSQQRNIARGQSGGRTVPEDIRKEKWDNVQKSRPQYAEMFGDSYTEFDNSEDLRNAPPEIKSQKNDELMKIYKNVQQFVNKPPKTPSSNLWITSELEKKDTQKIDSTKTITPHEGSKAAEESRKLGLSYYGFGRYGKNGKVSHRSLHDKLVPIESLTEDLRQWFNPNHPKGGWKRLNTKGEVIGDCARDDPNEPKPKCMSNAKRAMLSKKERAAAVRSKRKYDPNSERKGSPINVSSFGKGKLSESVTVSITADTPEEIDRVFSQMFNKEFAAKQESSFSGKDAENMLLLGTKRTVTEINDKSVTFSNSDIKNILEKTDDNYILDKDKKPRVFVIRALAAKEAHVRNGEIVKTQKGYLVKLKGNANVQMAERNVHETTENRFSNYRLGKSTTSSTTKTTSFLTEQTSVENESRTKESAGKITISEIYKRKKAKINKESIDKGIESGVSMAASGESTARDMGEKHKKNGKASQVTEDEELEEMAGANMNTRDIHVHLKKQGWKLSRTSGGHDVFTHAKAEHHIAVPRHNKIKAPLVLGILKSSKNIQEMTGDETTASIGAQAEDELKKKGISLTSFKKRNFI